MEVHGRKMGKVQGMPYSDIHDVRDSPRDKKFRKSQFLFILIVSVFHCDV